MTLGRIARLTALLIPLAGCDSRPETGATIALESQSEEQTRRDAMETYSKEIKAKKAAPAKR